MGSSHTLDQLDTCFDDTHAVANAGLLLAATLAERLGIEQAADQVIDLGERAGAHRPGRKLLTLVHALLAGGDGIDDADLLRCGQTASVLGHRVMAPSTLGTFLRSFTFGHVRQLDRLTEQTLKRAWAAGAGPGDGPMTMDLDSTVCEVHGHAKQGAAYGYTRKFGYHPLVASRAGTGEVRMQPTSRRGVYLQDPTTEAEAMAGSRSFEEFYSAAVGRLLGQLFPVTGDLHEAEEIVQEAFTRAAARWSRLRDYDVPEAQVRRVAMNLAADRARNRRRQTRATLRLRPPAAVLPASVEALALVEALRTLSLRQRQVLVLHYLVDLPVDEVARTLGMPEGTVKSLLSRGRQALAAKLGEAEEVLYRS